MSTVTRRVLTTLAVLLWAGTAVAQNQAAQAQSSGGGVPAGGGIRHLTSTGVGMAVGRSAGGNIVSYEGFLARYVAARDTVAPVFDPPLANVRVVIPANAVACEASVNVALPRAVDNRDPNPVVTLFRVVAGNRVALAPGALTLPRGSHDIVAVATDRRGNATTGTYRIDVVDTTNPTIASTPNPTPVGMEAEATSPAGTPVVLAAATCTDVCGNPTLTNTAPARFPLGDTAVVYTCTDTSGNTSTAQVTVRVRDRSAPTVAAGGPANFAVECNNPVGSQVAVPAIAWQDNGFNANQLALTLIVDPAGANTTFNPVPLNVTLTGGAHVLRYVAQDPAGNRGQFDLNVTVSDSTAPRIEVINAPALGWYNQDAQVNLRITDNCSALGNALQVQVQPPAAGQSINAGVLTLLYRADGIYSLNVTVTDGANNSVSDNSVGFGIDRTPPSVSVVVPSQQDVVVNQNYTYPLYAMAENMPLNMAGDDPGDGQVSGVRRVQVLLDPDAQGRPVRTLTDRTFVGNGNPQRGARSQNNIRCTDNVAGDVQAKCNAAGEVSMRTLPLGAHTLRTIVTDFAGNVTQADAKVLNANLRDGLDVVGTRIQARLAAQPALPAATVQNFQAALPKLTRGRLVSGVAMPESPFGTPMFLGGALKAVQDSTTNLDLAVAAAPVGEQPRLKSLIQTLQRVAHSDLSLFNQVIVDTGVMDSILRDPDLTQWLLPEYTTDMGDAADFLAGMQASTAAERWTQAAQDGVDAFFSLKSAWSGWMMDYHYNPQDAFPAQQFARGADILAQIEDELTTYLTIQNAPAAQKATDMRDRLAVMSADLSRLAQNGFDTAGGLSDQRYMEDMLEVQNIANSSMVGNQQGLWVRNYQWSIMQVVRLMAQSSTANARLRKGAIARNWAVFTEAQARIENGVGLLEQRRVQDAINLYGEALSTCSIISVYHCNYLDDETVGAIRDTDQAYLGQFADACWANNWAIRPDRWAAAPAGSPPAECRWRADIR